MSKVSHFFHFSVKFSLQPFGQFLLCCVLSLFHFCQSLFRFFLFLLQFCLPLLDWYQMLKSIFFSIPQTMLSVYSYTFLKQIIVARKNTSFIFAAERKTMFFNIDTFDHIVKKHLPSIW